MGKRNSPVSRPSSFIAPLSGIGFVAKESMSRIVGTACGAASIGCKVTLQRSGHHGDQVFRNDIGCDRDHPLPADAHHRQREGVIAAKDGQVGGVEDL